VDGLIREVFEYEIALQCRFILRGAELLENALQRWPEREARQAELKQPALSDQRRFEILAELQGPGVAMMTEIWFALQIILVAAANISKMLWGTRRAGEEDREELRSRLGVLESSPMESPSLRNDFEHFDERLTGWGKKQKGSRTFVGRNIWHEPDNAVPIIPDEPPNRRFGHFDPVSPGVLLDKLRERARHHPGGRTHPSSGRSDSGRRRAEHVGPRPVALLSGLVRPPTAVLEVVCLRLALKLCA
jgi:hypothetical protein